MVARILADLRLSAFPKAVPAARCSGGVLMETHDERFHQMIPTTAHFTKDVMALYMAGAKRVSR